MASSGLVALDVVLRECAPSLPSVIVRVIRMYADVPLVLKLRRAQLNHADAARFDMLVEIQDNDLKFYARELRLKTWRPEIYPLNDVEIHRVNVVVVYAAEIGSIRVVKWALRQSPNVDTSRILRVAYAQGNLAMVQAVRKLRSWYVVNDSLLLRLAATGGHLDVFEWAATHPRFSAPVLLVGPSRAAACHGHVAILEWIATHGNRKDLRPSLLQDAAAHGQQSVLEWIHVSDIPVSAAAASDAMDVAAKALQYDALEWLHTTYPTSALSVATLQAMTADTSQCDRATSLVERFPERYAHYDRSPPSPSPERVESPPKSEPFWRRVVGAMGLGGGVSKCVKRASLLQK